VATHYTQSVLGWPGPVRQLGPRVCQVENGAQVAVITLNQPLGGADTVWVVASVVRSKS
jgi:hypothetical protein